MNTTPTSKHVTVVTVLGSLTLISTTFVLKLNCSFKNNLRQ